MRLDLGEITSFAAVAGRSGLEGEDVDVRPDLKLSSCLVSVGYTSPKTGSPALECWTPLVTQGHDIEVFNLVV